MCALSPLRSPIANHLAGGWTQQPDYAAQHRPQPAREPNIRAGDKGSLILNVSCLLLTEIRAAEVSSLFHHAQGSTLTGNTAVDSGGAVTCLSCSELSTQMTTFSNNTAAEGYGGGLQCVPRTSSESHTCLNPQIVHAVMPLPVCCCNQEAGLMSGRVCICLTP